MKGLGKSSVLTRVAAVLLLVVFGLVILHAPIIMMVGAHWPSLDIIVKGWKEGLMAFAGVFLAVEVSRWGMWRELFRSTVLRLIAAFVALHLLSLLFFWLGLHATVAGLLIDLRYVVYFALVFILMRLQPGYAPVFVKVGITGALVVVIFAMLQVFVLPKDVLGLLGYSKDTIAPYMTVDQNHDYIRINSTLRGPNPLGAYAIIVLGMLAAFLAATRTKRQAVTYAILAILGAGGVVALWASYSRSALVGGCIAVGVAVAVGFSRYIKPKHWLLAAGVLIAVIAGVFAFRHTSFVSNVILHERLGSDTTNGSNIGHINSLDEGLRRLARQPLGAGIGSTGSPSYYSDSQPTLYIENQYLNVAHEVGWLGLLLYIIIIVAVLKQLWSARRNYLALGLFASGVGLSFVALLLPVWVDDTVSLVWWGAAGVVLGSQTKQRELSLARRFISWNRRASKWIDTVFVPAAWRVDGLKEYIEDILPPLTDRAKTIYDIGGGKRPYVGTVVARSKQTKTIVGLDIDQRELDQAPASAYDKTIAQDIGARQMKPLRPLATLVICQMVLEHVFDNKQAIKNIYRFTAKNGTVTICVPSRNALFATINRLLPESIKRRLLHGIFPESAHAQGFPAYYHDCTPKEMIGLMEHEGFAIETVRYYFQGTYFTFFVPFHIVWRLYQAVAYMFIRRNAADYFCIIARK